MMLWAPREYELFRLAEGGQAEQLLWRYLQQAPVSEAFVWRRWLYLLWDEVDSLVNTGALIAPVLTSLQNHSCPGSPELPFSHCQTRPRVS